MNKSRINKKELRISIYEHRLNGKSDQEIYNDLSAKYHKYHDKKTLALLVAGTVTPELREKYKVPNTILLVLISMTILLKVLLVFNMSLEFGKVWPLFMIFLLPVLNVYFFYEVYYFNAIAYRPIGYLTIVGLLNSLAKSVDPNPFDLLFNVTIAGSIIVLSFYLSRRLLPNFKPGKLAKDSKGEYVLSTANANIYY
jgi:hypothetical protein